MYITTDFSARLAEIMAERGLKQSDLSSLVSVSQGTVSGWLNGAVPQPRTANALCEKLDVNPDWLLGGVGKIQRGKVVPGAKVSLGIVEPEMMKKKKSLECLSKNLQAIRGSMPVSDFAELVGMSKPEVYERYEKGRVPRPLIFQRIANRIGASVEELLTPLTDGRIRKIRSEMARVSKEVVHTNRPLTHNTRLVFIQARQDLVTPETRQSITQMLKLRELPAEKLCKLYKHLTNSTFDSPIEIGRYYYPLFDAVGMEINRRSEKTG